ncbi:MAG: TIGR02757 family protein [Bacteroidales bacterium]|nr:TIGR02757 family protein [Bacteroidales bacterium]MCF8399076.1 TIGR02757 family protein [Bacteroidales bacterium]
MDPVSIPHLFKKKEDIEIAAYLAATIAWGQRKTIIRNALSLMAMMDNAPHDFVLNANDADFKKFLGFVHRTFNGSDCIYFLNALQNIYVKHGGLEKCFEEKDVKEGILKFRKIFFELPHLPRTQKHLANPAAGASAKRINMFLRWMIRDDGAGIDFGIWRIFTPSQLYCPLDIHSGNAARKLGLLKRKQNDWKAVEELTRNLRNFDAEDPVKYDIALFALGVEEKC